MTIIRDVLVKITADNSGLNKGLDAAQAGLKKFAVAAGAALAAATASFAAMVPVAARSATEISRFSQVANASTTEFQRWAAGAKTAGIEQEKLADILKDVNDRVGDFLTTGGGPMADFFENIAPKVGVTADQFARLSGPEALQLYVDSLEKAGVNQQQMTFYMEAMAGDLTTLLPLLRNGGAEMNRFGDAAEKAGRIYSPEQIRAGEELDRVLGDIAATLKNSATKAVLDHKDELIALADWISSTVIPAIGDLFDMIGQTGERLAPAIEAWKTLARTIAAAMNLDSAYDATANANGNADNGTDLDDQVFFAGQDDPSNSGAWPLDKNGNVIMDDGSVLETKLPPIVPPSKDKKGGGGGGKGGGGEDKAIQRRLESLQNSLATEAEWLVDFYEEGQKTLDDALATRLISEEEYRAERERLEAEHHDRMRELDRAAMQEKLAGWSGALGDLASLMTSGNKKMFAIGKAAAVAQAIVDGWSAATSAWDRGMKVGGPPVAAAFTAMSLARTGAMIASLKSTSFNGGGSGGGAGGAGVTAAPAAMPTQRVDIAWGGPAESRPGMQVLLDTLNDAAARGLRLDARLVAP